MRQLRRSRDCRLLGGVLAGIACYLGLDVALVRGLAGVLVILSLSMRTFSHPLLDIGVKLAMWAGLYGALWVAIPLDQPAGAGRGIPCPLCGYLIVSDQWRHCPRCGGTLEPMTPRSTV
ncbi:MAG: PspC domain-containing protein [Deinococcus sp.]|nr:PspC domain-containing protein [Deinococcus sp.]